MNRVFWYRFEDVLRGKSDGEWDWDAHNLRRVYALAESQYIERGATAF